MVFGCRFPVRLLRFVLAEALPAHAEVTRQAWDGGSAGVPLAGLFRAGARAESPGFPGDPSCASALLQHPGRAGKPSPWSGLADAAPGEQHTEGLSGYLISRLTTQLQHLLPTLHEQRCRRPCKAHFRLVGCAFAGGSRTLWIALKGFRLHPSSFPGLRLAQAVFRMTILDPKQSCNTRGWGPRHGAVFLRYVQSTVTVAGYYRNCIAVRIRPANLAQQYGTLQS